MSKIVPNIDVYGRYATASALADYLELLALQGDSLTRVEVVDMIDDNNWRRRAAENFVVPGEEEEEGEPDERIYNLIAERSEILGDAYPFTTDAAGRLEYIPDRPGGPYRAFLSIATAHAYKLKVPSPPEEVFERTVAAVLSGRGWLGINFAGVRRGGASFDEALEACGAALQLTPAQADAPRSKRAQDAGADAIVHIPWCTVRPGRWILVGQVTCAMSNEWQAKLMQASPHAWRPLLGEIVAPWIFLAVPHHAEAKHRITIVWHTNNVLLDRLSLVRHKAAVSEEETALIDAVEEADVEKP